MQIGLETLRGDLLTCAMSKQSNIPRRSRRRPPAPCFDDIPPFTGNEIQVIGNPANMTGPPVVREARLEDCDDDCPVCVRLRKQILAGNPPQVMVFE